jgi:hypothetical protein
VDLEALIGWRRVDAVLVADPVGHETALVHREVVAVAHATGAACAAAADTADAADTTNTAGASRNGTGDSARAACAAGHHHAGRAASTTNAADTTSAADSACAADTTCAAYRQDTHAVVIFRSTPADDNERRKQRDSPITHKTSNTTSEPYAARTPAPTGSTFEFEPSIVKPKTQQIREDQRDCAAEGAQHFGRTYVALAGSAKKEPSLDQAPYVGTCEAFRAVRSDVAKTRPTARDGARVSTMRSA